MNAPEASGRVLADPATRIFRPARPTGTGALVLAGSSGRVDARRADFWPGTAALALAIRWFGGPGQQPGPFEVPIGLFSEAVDALAGECDRIVLVGTSFGAEAALVTAARDRRIHATIAFAPSSVVRAGVDGGRLTSHWTADGEPLPYVPFLEDWKRGSRPSHDPAGRGTRRRRESHEPRRKPGVRLRTGKPGVAEHRRGSAAAWSRKRYRLTAVVGGFASLGSGWRRYMR